MNLNWTLYDIVLKCVFNNQYTEEYDFNNLSISELENEVKKLFSTIDGIKYIKILSGDWECGIIFPNSETPLTNS